MGRKKKVEVKETVQPFCYYCDREFEDEGVLIQHQKSKHFKCHVCNKKMTTVGALLTHSAHVHKEGLKAVPNAKEGRESTHVQVYGMEGVPDEFLIPGAKRARHEGPEGYDDEAADEAGTVPVAAAPMSAAGVGGLSMPQPPLFGAPPMGGNPGMPGGPPPFGYPGMPGHARPPFPFPGGPPFGAPGMPPPGMMPPGMPPHMMGMPPHFPLPPYGAPPGFPGPFPGPFHGPPGAAMPPFGGAVPPPMAPPLGMPGVGSALPPASAAQIAPAPAPTPAPAPAPAGAVSASLASTLSPEMIATLLAAGIEVPGHEAKPGGPASADAGSLPATTASGTTRAYPAAHDAIRIEGGELVFPYEEISPEELRAFHPRYLVTSA